MFDEPLVAYYQKPEVPSELAEVEKQLVGIGKVVKVMYSHTRNQRNHRKSGQEKRYYGLQNTVYSGAILGNYL